MSTVLMYVLGVVIFVVGLALSIGLHELGHLIPGKLFNIKVTQYFIGFGRTLWSRTRGETEYGVKAIPLGGYVKLVGMLPPPKDEGADRREVPAWAAADYGGDAAESGPSRVRSTKTGMFGQLMADAKDNEYENVEPGDEHRLFYNQSVPKRLVVMLSGVAVNLVLALLLFGVVYMGHGVHVPSTTVSTVSQCAIVVSADRADGAQRACRASDPVSPARQAGLRPGDRIVSFNGTSIDTWPALRRAVSSNDAGTARIGIVRDGRSMTLSTNTIVAPQADLNDPSTSVRAGFLGVVPTSPLERQGPGYVLDTMASATWDTLKALGQLPVKVYHVGRAALGLEERDATGPMSVVGAGRVAGELTSTHTVPLSDRLFSVLLLLAGLNLFLGLFNLVPLPPMDGGSMAPAIYEAARRRWARLRRRPDPGFVDSSKLLPLTYTVATVLLLASVVLIYADIVAPVQLS